MKEPKGKMRDTRLYKRLRTVVTTKEKAEMLTQEDYVGRFGSRKYLENLKRMLIEDLENEK